MRHRGASPYGGRVVAGTRQLLVSIYGSDSRFEGQLIGAVERFDAGSALRVLDGLFVTRDAESGELSAILLSDSPPSRMTSRALDFRLDDRGRRAATRQALEGEAREAVEALGAVLQPGMTIAALLVEHRSDGDEADDAAPLADAVARLGGTQVLSEPVTAGRMAELTPRLVAAASGALPG
jgi:hypothetical protein